jgi:hypothetical protein
MQPFLSESGDGAGGWAVFRRNQPRIAAPLRPLGGSIGALNNSVQVGPNPIERLGDDFGVFYRFPQ